ncbi:hypothetical protein DSM107007_28420 [Nostoc sp. PCC 7120 = FACHB-418]|nr:hypothetical protein DSM107007_28420 [Nostoc sp. PCC 7120 = FACHB-418]
MAGVDDTCVGFNWMDTGLWGETTAAASPDILAVNYLPFVILAFVSVGTAIAEGYANCTPNHRITIG